MTPKFLSAVETVFQAYMGANHPTIPVYFSNSNVPEDLGKYVVLHIMSSEDVVPIHLGKKSTSRNVGVVQVDVYCPKGVGAGEANALAYDISRMFKRLELTVGTEGYAVLKDPSVTSRGEVRGRHKEQVRIPYRYDFSDHP